MGHTQTMHEAWEEEEGEEESQTAQQHAHEDDEGWEIFIDEQEELELGEADMDSDEDLDIEEVLRESSVESQLVLPPEQRRRDGWVWKTYLFVSFLVAYTKLSQECAALILSFIFNVLSPLIESAHGVVSAVDTGKDSNKLVTVAAVGKISALATVSRGTSSASTHRAALSTRGTARLLRKSSCIASTAAATSSRTANRSCSMLTAASPRLWLYCFKTSASKRPWTNGKPTCIVGKQLRTGDMDQFGQARHGVVIVPCSTARRHASNTRPSSTTTPASTSRSRSTSIGSGRTKAVTPGSTRLVRYSFGSTTSPSGSALSTVDALAFTCLACFLDRRNHDRRRSCATSSCSPMSSRSSIAMAVSFQQRHILEVSTCLQRLTSLFSITVLYTIAQMEADDDFESNHTGRKIRARLNMVVADSPARAKTVDFSRNFCYDPTCPYCPKLLVNFGTREPWEEGPQDIRPPPPSNATAAKCKDTVIKELKYFDLVLDNPPDPMLAVLLGMCQRFWWDFLMTGCNILGGRGGKYKVERVQDIVRNAKLPSGLKKPDNRMGNRSAGPPSAEQWVTMYRCLLPFIMLSLWDRSLTDKRDEPLLFDTEQGSNSRPVLRGNKLATNIFPIGLLLCCVVELLEEDLDDAGVELRGFIIRFNVLLKEELGSGWLTFNTHIAEHIPDSIKRFGAGRNFSCLPFERTNGRLGRINTSARREGQLNATMMRTIVHQLDLRHMLAESEDSFLHGKVLKHVQSRSQQDQDSLSTSMGKVDMDGRTFQLLLKHLNATNRSFTGRFVVGHDPSRATDDVGVIPKARYLRTIVIESYPSEMRISSAAAAKGGGLGNTYVLVRTADGREEPVQILWLFEMTLSLHGKEAWPVQRRFMHVRKLKVVSTEVAMGGNVPNQELLDRLKISFASRKEYGGELVLPFYSFVSQLAVVAFDTDYRIESQVYGLKVL